MNEWLQIMTGLFGLCLIINAILVMIYPNYYYYLNKIVFIEPLSKQGIEKVEEFVNKNKDKEKRGIALILVLLGIIAIHWAMGGHFLGFY